MATRRRRRKKKGDGLYEFCHDWGMVLLIVGGMAAWASLDPEVGEPIGFMLLGAAVLLALADYVRPKHKGRRR